MFIIRTIYPIRLYSIICIFFECHFVILLFHYFNCVIFFQRTHIYVSVYENVLIGTLRLYRPNEKKISFKAIPK